MRTVGGVVALVVGVLVAVGPAAGAAAGLAREDSPGDPPLSVSVFLPRQTSVLLAVPLTDATAALSTSDAAYARLEALLEADRSSIQPRPPSGGGALGPSVVITWLVDDVHVWRVDRVYYEAPHGPWIATQVLRTGVDPSVDTGWHRSDDADRLLQELGELDLLGTDQSPDIGRPLAQASEESGGSSAESVPGWRWGLFGLVMGGLIVGMAQMLARRWAARGVPME